MKLIIVDDNHNFRGALKDYVSAGLQHEVIGEAESGDTFMKLTNIQDADIVLMDIEMKDTDGLSATQKIIALQPNLKIVAITMLVDQILLEQLIDHGFRGCIFKTDVFEELENALNTIIKGDSFFSKRIKTKNRNR